MRWTGKKISAASVKEPAIEAAKEMLRPSLKYFEREEGLKASIAIEDRGTIDIFNTVMGSEYPNLYFEQWCQKLVETEQHHPLGVLARHIRSLHLSDRPRVPQSLTDWLVERTGEGGSRDKPKSKRQHPRERHLRDLAIWKAAHAINDEFGLNLYRNPVVRDVESACSIVTKALQALKEELVGKGNRTPILMSESNVTQVVKTLNRKHRNLL